MPTTRLSVILTGFAQCSHDERSVTLELIHSHQHTLPADMTLKRVSQARCLVAANFRHLRDFGVATSLT